MSVFTHSPFQIMRSEQQHQNQDHAGSCAGHCRAQRFALDYYCTPQSENDKAALASFEEGWDRWDKPIWSERHTNDAEAQAKLEDTWEGCCNTPAEQASILATESLTPTEMETSRTRLTSPSVSAAPKKTISLWQSRKSSKSQCPNCRGSASPCNV
ncbi:hypothetical protein K504DRAFT_411668 [Pleomassaria siparia CBS 279.74]|uniref:Uncharacterized protein n=1 Tax=Pleomassaria siparia CBS 279.74 TaxID=1314801 RepID=A0A6G1K3I9_9PLEO|nr:hypothetical protein K504DRAFT_411668 [Pleomassaria siparia CBS 279.74]